MLVSLSHFFGLMSHVLVDDSLVHLFRREIGCIRMSEDVEAANDGPFRVPQSLAKLNASLISGEWFFRWGLSVIEVLTECVLSARMAGEPFLHNGDAAGRKFDAAIRCET